MNEETPRRRWAAMMAPLLVFYGLVFIAGQATFYRIALHPFTDRGHYDSSRYTLDVLASVFTDPYNRSLVLETLRFGVLIVLICLVLGFPLAYVIARSRRWGTFLLALVIIASFTGVVVRAIGWRALLAGSGPVNSLVMALGLSDGPLPLMNSMTGAIIGTAHAVLPFMVLLLAPVIESIDRNLEDAGAGLGASPAYVFRKIVVPLSVPGLVGGSLLVFATSLGTFTTPALLGGQRLRILAIAIRQQLATSLNYPLAAALSLVLVTMVVIVVASTMTVMKRGLRA